MQQQFLSFSSRLAAVEEGVAAATAAVSRQAKEIELLKANSFTIPGNVGATLELVEILARFKGDVHRKVENVDYPEQEPKHDKQPLQGAVVASSAGFASVPALSSDGMALLSALGVFVSLAQQGSTEENEKSTEALQLLSAAVDRVSKALGDEMPCVDEPQAELSVIANDASELSAGLQQLFAQDGCSAPDSTTEFFEELQALQATAGVAERRRHELKFREDAVQAVAEVAKVVQPSLLLLDPDAHPAIVLGKEASLDTDTDCMVSGQPCVQAALQLILGDVRRDVAKARAQLEASLAQVRGEVVRMQRGASDQVAEMRRELAAVQADVKRDASAPQPDAHSDLAGGRRDWLRADIEAMVESTILRLHAELQVDIGDLSLQLASLRADFDRKLSAQPQALAFDVQDTVIGPSRAAESSGSTADARAAAQDAIEALRYDIKLLKRDIERTQAQQDKAEAQLEGMRSTLCALDARTEAAPRPTQASASDVREMQRQLAASGMAQEMPAQVSRLWEAVEGLVLLAGLPGLSGLPAAVEHLQRPNAEATMAAIGDSGSASLRSKSPAREPGGPV